MVSQEDLSDILNRRKHSTYIPIHNHIRGLSIPDTKEWLDIPQRNKAILSALPEILVSLETQFTEDRLILTRVDAICSQLRDKVGNACRPPKWEESRKKYDRMCMNKHNLLRQMADEWEDICDNSKLGFIENPLKAIDEWADKYKDIKVEDLDHE